MTKIQKQLLLAPFALVALIPVLLLWQLIEGLLWLVCVTRHRGHAHVEQAFSNRTHKWKCDECGREWYD